MQEQADSPPCLAGSAHHMLRPYVAFNAALRSAYHTFVVSLEERSKMLLNHQLEVEPTATYSLCRCALTTYYKPQGNIRTRFDGTLASPGLSD